jgi:hypothetical protein
MKPDENRYTAESGANLKKPAQPSGGWINKGKKADQ